MLWQRGWEKRRRVDQREGKLLQPVGKVCENAIGASDMFTVSGAQDDREGSGERWDWSVRDRLRRLSIRIMISKMWVQGTKSWWLSWTWRAGKGYWNQGEELGDSHICPTEISCKTDFITWEMDRTGQAQTWFCSRIHNPFHDDFSKKQLKMTSNEWID